VSEKKCQREEPNLHLVTCRCRLAVIVAGEHCESVRKTCEQGVQRAPYAFALQRADRPARNNQRSICMRRYHTERCVLDWCVARETPSTMLSDRLAVSFCMRLPRCTDGDDSALIFWQWPRGDIRGCSSFMMPVRRLSAHHVCGSADSQCVTLRDAPFLTIGVAAARTFVVSGS